MDVFFEPHRIENIRKLFSIPFYFECKNVEPYHLARIYAVAGELVASTILTKEATPLFMKIHNKKNLRPVILQNEDIDVWLDKILNESDIQKIIDYDMPEVIINAYPINKDLYKRNGEGDRPYIIEKVEYEEIEY